LLTVQFSGETVTIPERSVRTVALVSEARLYRAAAVAGVVMLALWIIAVVLGSLDHQLSAGNVTTSAGFAVFAGVGVVVALHQPRNPVGWLLISFTFFFILGISTQEYAVYCYLLGHRLPFAPAAVVLKQSANFAFFLLPLAVFLFPDGRLTSPRWWWVLSAYAVVSGFFTASAFAPAIAAVADHDVHIDTSADLLDTGRLTGWLIHPPGWLTVAGALLIGGIWASFVIHQLLSWRRSDGERRQQLKWLACGAAVTLGIGVGASSVAPSFLSWVLGIALFALPVSIGVGILKYRLYDIDRIISRTLAYAIVTGLLIGVYTGLVLLTTHLLTFSSSAAVAASTLVAAALFNPLRRRVQRMVARRFNRARYDADQTVAAFAARLKDAVDLDAVRTDLAAVVQRTLEPAHVSVWIRSAGDDLASADRDPVTPLLAVVGEPGPEQGWPGGQDPPLDQGQRGAVLAGQAEPLGEHSPVAAASP
jgi:MFS family permease